MMSEIQELTIEGHPLQYEVQKVFVSSGSESIQLDIPAQLQCSHDNQYTQMPQPLKSEQLSKALQARRGRLLDTERALVATSG